MFCFCFVLFFFSFLVKSRYAHIELTDDLLLGGAEVAHIAAKNSETERDVEHPYQLIPNRNENEEDTVEHQVVDELATCDGLSEEYGCTNVSILRFGRKQYSPNIEWGDVERDILSKSVVL